MKLSSNKIINNLLLSFLICLIIFIISILIYYTEAEKRLQNSIYDVLFRNKSFIYNKKDNTDKVIIVPIDENSLQILEKKGLYWPWPRNLYQYISEYIIEQGAKAVVFDIIFSSQDINRASEDGTEVYYGIDNDMAFSNIMKESGKIILSFNIDNEQNKNDSILKTLEIENAGFFKNIKEYKSILLPYEIFAENNKNFGFVEIQGDYDGIIRNYRPFVKIKNKCYPSLASAIYLLVNDKKIPESLKLDNDGNFKLYWYGKGGVNKTFKYQSLISVLSDFYAMRKGEVLEIPKDTFKDKIVFVGATARGLLDMKSTPFSKEEAYPGVEIHATAYLNLLNKDWINSIPKLLEFSIIFLILFFLIFFGIDTKKPLVYTFIFILIFILLIFFHFYSFIIFNLQFETALMVIAFFLTYLAILITNYITVGFNRNKIKNAFSTYISPDLLNKVTNTDKPLTTSGDKVDASAIFIDIAGFTTFSEKNPVEKVVEILNLYLKKFSEVIIDNRGWVNKYLGDGLMAFFGAPVQFQGHAEMAVKSAFQCYKINNELAREYGLNIRIGVNSGKMIFGSFGGGKKLEFTAIGDSLNMTSRLEGANKFFNTNILVGESTKNDLKDEFDLKYLGKFSLKGKDIPSSIYYYNNSDLETKNKFDQMIKSYEAKDLKSFEEFIKFFSNKEFGPASFYINFFNGHKEKFGQPVKLTEK